VTFGGLPYSPLTVTLSKLLEAGTGLGVLLGLGLGLAVGVGEGGADVEVAGTDGEPEGEPESSSPHAPSRSEAKSPRTTAALAGNERTGKPYPSSAASRGTRGPPASVTVATNRQISGRRSWPAQPPSPA
jgi:hypothetical protein